MRVLVTGGAGFIGSHLVERLHKLGYEIRVLDNLSSGRKENLAGVMDYVDFMYGDVRDVDQVRRATLGMDAIIHLAALIDVEESVKNPLIYEFRTFMGGQFVMKLDRIEILSYSYDYRHRQAKG